ncbi:MAG: cyclic nucleotide-binding domain-containing protein [Deltaproteobacteria bacterium]|nr:cyclic nucleotide-binding domain-containing protein [Deltaproteobacteria bacterium]
MEHEITFGEGQVLFRQGEKGGDLYFLHEGKVDLVVRDDESGKEVTVATLGSKSVIGTMSFLEGEPRSATAKARSEVRCIKISQVQRDRLLQQVPSWFRILIKDLAGNLRRLNLQYTRLSAQMQELQKRYEAKEKQKERIEKESVADKEKRGAELDESKRSSEKLREDLAAARKEVEELKVKLNNASK